MRRFKFCIGFCLFALTVWGQKPQLPLPGGAPFPYGALQAMADGDSLGLFYQKTACGLNYVANSVILTKRAHWQGGVTQPAPIQISGIPCKNAVVEKAYLYWSIETTVDTCNVTVTNPKQQTQTLVGDMIGESFGKCWSCFGTRHFRADVTGLIVGNGAYVVSGLPARLGCDDTDGAALFIVYRDLVADYSGTFVLYDGNITDATGLNSNFTIENFNVCEPPAFARGFTLVADFQSNVSGPWEISLNGVTQNVSPLFFNFEQRNIVLTPNQQTMNVGANAFGSDCYSILLGGIYYQTKQCSPCVIDSALLADGGFLSGRNIICSSSDTTTLTVNGAGGVSFWEKSVAPFSSWQNIFQPHNDLTVTGITTPTRFRARLNAGPGCPDVYSNQREVSIKNWGASLHTQTIGCHGATDGGLSLILHGTRKPYIINWKKEGDFDFTTSDTFLTNLGPGVYHITFKDADECRASFTQTLTDPPIAELVFAGGEDTLRLCASGSVTLQLNGGAQALFWEKSVPPYNVWQNIPETTFTLTLNDINSDLRVRVFVKGSSPSCPDGFTPARQIYFGAFDINAQTQNVSCNGGSDGNLQILISGGKAPYQYSWQGPNGYSAQLSNINGLKAGAYSLTVTESGGCVKQDTFVLSEPAPLTAILITENESCALNGGGLSANINGGTQLYSVEWQDSLNQIIGQATSISPVLSGKYNFKVTDAKGCVFKDSVRVLPLLPTEILSVSVLNSQSAKISWKRVTGAKYKIEYFAPNVLVQSLDNLSDTIYTLSGLLPNKNYQVRVQAYCPAGLTTAWTAWEDFTTPPLALCPTPQITSVTPVPGKLTEVFIAWTPVSGAECYLLEYKAGAGNWITVSLTPNQNPFKLIGLALTTGYRFRLQAVCNACPLGLPSAYSPVVIYVTPSACSLAAFTINGGQSSVVDCDSALLKPDIAPQSFYQYQWKRNGLNIPGATHYGYIAHSPGKYRLMIREDTCAPVFSQNVQVSFQDVEIPSVATTVPPTCDTCADGSVSVSAILTSQGAIPSFLYSIDGVNYQTTNVFSGLSVGIYTIYIRIANTFCFATREVEIAPPCKPAQTFISSLTGVTQTQAVVNWYALTACVTSYDLRFRKTNAPDWTIISSLASNTYLLANLETGVAYEVSARGVSPVGVKGDWSASKTFTTQGNATICQPPTQIKATAVTAHSANVAWTNAVGAQTVEIQYRYPNSAWQTLTVQNADNFTLSNLQAGRTYSYKLRSFCGNVFSVYTPNYTFTTPLARENGAETEDNLYNYEVGVYPNPGVGRFTLLWREPLAIPAQIQVTDAAGKIVYQATVSENEKEYILNFENAPAGVYLLVCVTQEKTLYAKIFKM